MNGTTNGLTEIKKEDLGEEHLQYFKRESDGCPIIRYKESTPIDKPGPSTRYIG
ncbi:MAG: hypothetical protein JSW73_03195 [Candidatus Woesearchaeota archaeon]|nr:MAG: hypothetical protein JSW73_03195 [Candidatus Woesearchaeota archaeon]